MTKQKKQEARLKRWEIEEYISWQSRDNRWRLRWVDASVLMPLTIAVIMFTIMLYMVDPVGSLLAWLHPEKSTVYVLSDLHWLRVLSLLVFVEFLVRWLVVRMMDTVVEPCRKQAEFLLNGLPQICRKPGRLSYIFAFISAICVLLSYSSCYYFTDKAIIHTGIIPSWNWKVPYETICSVRWNLYWYGRHGRRKTVPGERPEWQNKMLYRLSVDCNFKLYNNQQLHLSEANLVLNECTNASKAAKYVSRIIAQADYKQKHYQIHQKFKAYFPITYR
jgi:hypothetical protein